MYSWQIDQMLVAKNNILRPAEFELLIDKQENPSIQKVECKLEDRLYDITTNDGYSWTIWVKYGNK